MQGSRKRRKKQSFSNKKSYSEIFGGKTKMIFQVEYQQLPKKEAWQEAIEILERIAQKTGFDNLQDKIKEVQEDEK